MPTYNLSHPIASGCKTLLLNWLRNSPSVCSLSLCIDVELLKQTHFSWTTAKLPNCFKIGHQVSPRAREGENKNKHALQRNETEKGTEMTRKNGAQVSINNTSRCEFAGVPVLVRVNEILNSSTAKLPPFYFEYIWRRSRRGNYCAKLPIMPAKL